MGISGLTVRGLAMATGKQLAGIDIRDVIDDAEDRISTLEDRFGTALGTILFSGTAAGTIPAYRLVKGHTDGTLLVGTAASKRIIGANVANASVSAAGTVSLGVGFVNVVAAEPILAGDLIKCGDNGRVLQLADADNVSTVIGTGTAGNFGNQPAGDVVTIVSDAAADDAEVTIIGTTHGGHTLVTETKALDGTTPVNTTKDNWGIVVAVKLSAACAGTVTIRETSASQTITTIAAAALSAGVVTIAAAAQGAHGLIPYINAAGASTKEVGVLYEPATGAADAYMAAALTGDTAAALPAAANLVKEIYLGDVATGTVATVYTNATEDDENACVGKVVANITAGSTGTAFLRS